MGLKTLMKNYNELGHKGFMEKWKEGIQKVTPEQLVKTEIIGYIGNLIGIIVVCIILAFTSVWYIIFAFVFGLLISASQLIGKIQQLQQLKAINQIMNNQISVEDYVKSLDSEKLNGGQNEQNT